jgi:hypothetical protein
MLTPTIIIVDTHITNDKIHLDGTSFPNCPLFGAKVPLKPNDNARIPFANPQKMNTLVLRWKDQ